MRPFLACLLAALLLGPLLPAASARAQASAPADSDSAKVGPVVARKPPPKEPRLFFGGSLSLSGYGRHFSVSVQPFIGYRMTRKLSLGGRVSYEYLKDSRTVPTFESSSYGAGVFSRYRLLRQAYAQTELAFASYDWADGRHFVPMLLVGGGYAQPLGPKTWLVVDVLFDVIRDKHSPYRDWQPRVTTGISTSY